MQAPRIDFKALGIEGITPNNYKEYLSECEYKCHKGKIYMPAMRNFVDCPHCSAIYKAIAEGTMKDDSGRDIYKILCIPSRYWNVDVSIENIFPASIVGTTSAESRADIITTIKDILSCIENNIPIRDSFLFYLGLETDILPLVFTILRKGYSKGLKVLPYLSTMDLIQLYKADEEPIDKPYSVGEELKKEFGCTYIDYCKCDLCIISIPAAAGKSSISIAHSILRSRQARGLSTILFSETEGSSRELGYTLNSEYLNVCAISANKSRQQNSKNSTEEASNRDFKKPAYQQETLNLNSDFGVDSELKQADKIELKKKF